MKQNLTPILNPLMKNSKMSLSKLYSIFLGSSIVKIFMMFLFLSCHCFAETQVLSGSVFQQNYVYHDSYRKLYEIHNNTPISAKEAFAIARSNFKTSEREKFIHGISLNGEEYFFMTTPKCKFGYREVGIYVNYNTGGVRHVVNFNKYIRRRNVEPIDYQYSQKIEDSFYEWEKQPHIK